jgi:hypothetical protein
MPIPPLPNSIAGLPVPQDEVSAAAWRRANAALPRYLLAHSVRSYCWGAAIGAWEGLTVDGQILWTAALFHDVGLARSSRNSACFEVEGAEIARRFLERNGMEAASADRAARAIVDHMRQGVTLADGVESVLLDRATGLDVRGVDIELVERVRGTVVRKYPRGKFDRHFLRAIEREAALRPTCQAARLLHETDLAGWMARSPWAADAP